VLLAALIDLGPQSAPAQSVLHLVAERTIKEPATACHCCLEFYSVATRLPPEYRLQPADAVLLRRTTTWDPRRNSIRVPREHW
jgi:hypothetical protein